MKPVSSGKSPFPGAVYELALALQWIGLCISPATWTMTQDEHGVAVYFQCSTSHPGEAPHKMASLDRWQQLTNPGQPRNRNHHPGRSAIKRDGYDTRLNGNRQVANRSLNQRENLQESRQLLRYLLFREPLWNHKQHTVSHSDSTQMRQNSNHTRLWKRHLIHLSAMMTIWTMIK